MAEWRNTVIPEHVSNTTNAAQMSVSYSWFRPDVVRQNGRCFAKASATGSDIQENWKTADRILPWHAYSLRQESISAHNMVNSVGQCYKTEARRVVHACNPTLRPAENYWTWLMVSHHQNSALGNIKPVCIQKKNQDSRGKLIEMPYKMLRMDIYVTSRTVLRKDREIVTTFGYWSACNDKELEVAHETVP